MEIALNPQNLQLDLLLSKIGEFFKNIVDKYKPRAYDIENIEKEIDEVTDIIIFLNEKVEVIANSSEFEQLEDKLIDMKFLLESKLETLPAHLQPSFGKLYEALSLLIFNLSLYEMSNEIENYRDEKV